ncbi:hypothetical protein BJV82DRAFT_672363 [Fennellomyces sp. T-0311]|nr:hypothetical protein BJV82DRAFT_672363 [Fennellomyces sp. T-0311]
MGWFDQSKEGSLTTRLATDSQYTQGSISENFRAMAFGLDWNLAVIVLAVVSVLGGVGRVMKYFITKSTLKVQDAVADNAAEQVFCRHSDYLCIHSSEPNSQDVRRKTCQDISSRCSPGYIMGFGLGGFLFVLFCIYAIAFWYGGVLPINETLETRKMVVSFFCILLGVMSLLQLPDQLSTISTV